MRGNWRTTGARAGLAAGGVLLMIALLAFVAAGGGGSQAASAATADPADLSVSKSDSPDPVAPGGALTYTIAVTNSGPDAATNVVVTDNLPGEVSFQSATASGPSGSCKRSGATVTCDLGTVPVTTAATPGPTVTIKVTVKKNVKATQISNTASVSSDTTDPNSVNNSDTELTGIVKAGAGVSCRNQAATIVGTGGNDVLGGTAGNDVIVAFAGNDTIASDGGRDLICAGRGADTVNSGPGADFVKGAGGPDLIKGRRGGDELRGNRGRDRLRGNAGPDLLAGGRGFDRCRGGAGRDTLRSCER
jgi:uncharacterized repeat protein (TIGR01451 family)